MLERLADCAKDGAYFGASGLTIIEQASASDDGVVDIAALTQEPPNAGQNWADFVRSQVWPSLSRALLRAPTFWRKYPNGYFLDAAAAVLA